MKNYEKPVVMVNEGMAEGVYAASGACWVFTVKKTGYIPPEGSNEEEYQIDGVHTDPDQHLASFAFVCTFDQDVEVLSCGAAGGYILAGNVVTVTHNISTNNTTENYGFTLKVKGLGTTPISAPSVSYQCPY